MSGHEDKRQIDEEMHRRLCAWMFGELEGEEARTFEAELERSPELQAERARLAATIGLVQQSLPAETLSASARATVMAAADEPAAVTPKWTFLRGGGAGWKVAAGIVVLFTGLVLVRTTQRRALLEQWQAEEQLARQAPAAEPENEDLGKLRALGYRGDEESAAANAEGWRGGVHSLADESRENASDLAASRESGKKEGKDDGRAQDAPVEELLFEGVEEHLMEVAEPVLDDAQRSREAERDALATSLAPNAPVTSPDGDAALGVSVPQQESTTAGGRLAGNATARSKAGEAGPDVARRAETRPVVSGAPPPSPKATVPTSGRAAPPAPASPGVAGAVRPGAPSTRRALEDLGYAEGEPEIHPGATSTGSEGWFLGSGHKAGDSRRRQVPPQPGRWTEEELEEHCLRIFRECRPRPRETPSAMFFRYWGDNPFEVTRLDPLSTFAVDVDTASYTLARRYLNEGYLPTKAQIRTEEFVNYFDADVPPPTDGETFALDLELAPSLFGGDPDTWMLRVAVRGEDVDPLERQPVTLTFVVDVSGSMKGVRMDMVKQAMAFCARQLSTTDSIALVTFNSEARLVVPMISAASRGVFEEALVRLTPGGSTNVAGGLTLGYELAAAALTPGTVNRVILLSDGVGNVGETDQERILETVADYKAEGIYLNTVGVGMGNHNDAFLEQLADKGDGLCHYVDRLDEARRVFVEEFVQTLQPIARDVKVQVEFDPEQVERYRLLGYENRAIRDEDFRNDAIDAGEVNAGHQVVALYELVRRPSGGDGPLATARLRWKPPFAIDRAEGGPEARAQAEKAFEREVRLHAEDGHAGLDSTSFGYRRDVLVAQFAEFLRRSRHARHDSFEKMVMQTRKLQATTRDEGLAELVDLMEKASALVERRQRSEPPVRDLVDELCELHYLEALRDQLLEDGPESEVDDPALDAELERLRKELEARIRRQLRARHVDGLDPDRIERLRGLGYTEDR